MFYYAIPALRNCAATSVLLPDAPQALFLAEGLYHVISREPLLHIKNASDIHSVSVSMIPCQACILRPSCRKILTLNQGDLFLEPDMDYCSTSPEPFFATIELIPSLEQVFKHVPQSNHVFHAYSLGEARHFVLNNVRIHNPIRIHYIQTRPHRFPLQPASIYLWYLLQKLFYWTKAFPPYTAAVVWMVLPAVNTNFALVAAVIPSCKPSMTSWICELSPPSF